MRRPGRKSSSNNKKGKSESSTSGNSSVSSETSRKKASESGIYDAMHRYTSSSSVKGSSTGSTASTMISGPAMLTVGSPQSAMKDLPLLRDAPLAKREALFIQKLQLCGVIFSFEDPSSHKRGKDMKRQTLLELVDYVNTPAGQKIFTESVMADLMACISANVCRALPPATDDFDPEEDEPVLEPAWPHLQVAYEFFLRFIVSSEVNAKAAKKICRSKILFAAG